VSFRDIPNWWKLWIEKHELDFVLYILWITKDMTTECHDRVHSCLTSYPESLRFKSWF
jgi:hypothetical protein